MKVLGVIYLASVIWFTFFAKLTVNKRVDNNIIHKFIASLWVGVFIVLFFGLPLLGILYLLGL